MTDTQAIDLIGLTEEELAELMARLGQPRYRARQILRWLYATRVSHIGEMTDLPLASRQALSEIAFVGRLSVQKKQASDADGTTKFLFGLLDGESVETVLLPHDYGVAVCVSSQVGCRMGCKFCASAKLGMVRNLTAGEMIQQVLGAAEHLPEDRRVSHITVMGIGEPLANLDNLLSFLKLAHLPIGLGISYRNMTVSTCGLVPQIGALAESGLPVTLAISLHAPDDELRDTLMPVNRKHPLPELIDACKRYAETSGRRVTYEYAMLKGVNDSAENAARLAKLLRGSLCHVNLIPANPVPEAGFERSSDAQIEEFKRILVQRGIEVTVRREMGTEIEAACGQLRRRTATKR